VGEVPLQFLGGWCGGRMTSKRVRGVSCAACEDRILDEPASGHYLGASALINYCNYKDTTRSERCIARAWVCPSCRRLQGSWIPEQSLFFHSISRGVYRGTSLKRNMTLQKDYAWGPVVVLGG
jgi:hypothetical protein